MRRQLTARDVENLPPTISVQRAGEILGVSRPTSYELLRRGELPALKLGNRYHVKTAELLAMIGIEYRAAASPVPAAIEELASSPPRIH